MTDTDIHTTPEMFETLIRIVERCVIGNGAGSSQFECLGKENSFADIVAHAHIFLSQMRDHRGDGTVIRITKRCFEDILFAKDEEGARE